LSSSRVKAGTGRKGWNDKARVHGVWLRTLVCTAFGLSWLTRGGAETVQPRARRLPAGGVCPVHDPMRFHAGGDRKFRTRGLWAARQHRSDCGCPTYPCGDPIGARCALHPSRGDGGTVQPTRVWVLLSLAAKAVASGAIIVRSSRPVSDDAKYTSSHWGRLCPTTKWLVDSRRYPPCRSA